MNIYIYIKNNNVINYMKSYIYIYISAAHAHLSLISNHIIIKNIISGIQLARPKYHKFSIIISL